MEFFSAASQLLIAPFAEFEFMRRALLGSISLSLGATPFGVLLVLRRLSLTGDAMAHAILPGAAIGYLLAGMSLIAMTLGGLIAGVLVALLSGYVTRATHIKEDASLAAFYLMSLALGVIIVSLRGGNVDLLHVLFGSILALDTAALWLIAIVAFVSLASLSLCYRAWILETFDPEYFKVPPYGRAWIHNSFLILCVLNLVSGFHAFGTLMSVGIIILPAICARFWGRSIPGLILIAALIVLLCSYTGLLLAYHHNLPAGPSIIMLLGLSYLVSLFAGAQGGLLRQVTNFGSSMVH